MGNAGGDALWVFNSGIVKAVYQKELSDGGLRRRRFQCVETTEPINPGDSGGPVVNDSGELVAVNDSHQLFDENGRPVSLMTFAIDVSEVRAFLDEVRPMLHPKTADDYQRRGLRYLSRQRYDEAISDFDETMRQLSAGTDPAGVLMNRGLAYARRGTSRGNSSADLGHSRADLEKAITDLTEALDSKSGDPELLIYRGDCFYKTNDFSSAKSDFEDAIKLARDKRVKSEILARAHFGLNLMLPKQDQAGKVELLTQAIRLDPQNFLYHLQRGTRFMNLEQPARALEDTQKAFVIAQNELDPTKWAEIQPHVEEAFFNRAVCYALLNHKSEARQDYMTLLGIVLRQLRDRPATIVDARHIILIGRGLFHLPNSEADAFKLFELAQKIAPQIASERTRYEEREVYFINRSQQNLVLYVIYHTLQEGQWKWLPGELWSGDSVKAGVFKPGEEGFLISKDGKIHADRIRLYIMNDKNEKVSDKFWAEDLVLVPESYLGYVRERRVVSFP
jgi:tetratricopeptide (TPR) repeat protein